MPDQNYLKPRLCLHYSAYYRVFNIFSPFVSPAIHIKTLLLLVVLCEKSNGAATARPSKGRPRRTEAVKRFKLLQSTFMLWNHSEEALGLEARSPKYCRYIKTWMRFEERLAMFKAKAKEAVAKQS